MPELFFTSDSHFGHKNILKFEPYHRPFKTIEEMNETLIDNHNKVVGRNDVVWHLGDFCFGKDNVHIAGRLNGHKKLVLGNHDAYQSAEYLKYFVKLYGCTFIHQFMLSHVPIRMTDDTMYGNIHGHLHSKTVKKMKMVSGKMINTEIDDPRYICVSVEQTNLTPINYDEIFNRVKDLDFMKYNY